jgi:hypothetical protein
MIRRLWRLFLALPTLMMIWGFANSAGITDSLNSAEGWNIPSFHVPVLDKIVNPGEQASTVTAAGQKIQDAATKAKDKARKAVHRATHKAKGGPTGTSTATGTPGGAAGGASGPTASDVRDAEWLTNAQIKTAADDLAALPIKGKAPMTGYTRSQFGTAWTDDNDDQWGHNGLDSRNDVLSRDLSDITCKTKPAKAAPHCVVATGVFHDPYTGTTIDFVRGPNSAVIQIDHVVPLANAWVTGAQSWTKAKRQDYANDPLVLLSSQGSANEQKSDSDASAWLPSNKAFRASYVARQVLVKVKYGLWVTQAEHDTMASILKAYA